MDEMTRRGLELEYEALQSKMIGSLLNHASRLTVKDGEIVLVDCDTGDETDA